MPGAHAVEMKPELTLLASLRGRYAFYRYGNVAINVWLAQPDGEAVQKLSELTTESRTSCPRGISSVHWLAAGIGVPTPEARAGLRALATRDGDHIACVATVLNGTGFWASALRSALSGILLVGPKAQFPTRVYGTAEELAAWLPNEHIRRTQSAVEGPVLIEKLQEAVRQAAQL